MADPGQYDDLAGGLPPDAFGAPAPDLASLAYPWTQPAPMPEPPPAGPPTQEQALAVPPPSSVAEMPDVSISTEQPPPGAPPPPEPAVLPSLVPPPAAPPAPGTTLPPGVAGPTVPAAEQRYRDTVQRYAANPNELVDRVLGGPIDADTQRYLNDFARRDPAGFGELNVRLADAKTKRVAAEQARIANEDYERQKANLEMRDKAIADAQRRSAELDAEATNIANTKVGYHPSTLQRIAGVIAAIVGGLYQGKTGSARNPGLDALNDVINRDIEEQKYNLANRRDVLASRRTAMADQLARSGDMYEAAEKSRLAALKHADDLLAQAQQNFAADGTRGIQIAQMRAGVAAGQAQARQAIEQKAFENSIKLQTAAREQQQADETARNNRAQLGLGYARLNEDRLQREETRKQREHDKAQERADKEAELDRRYSIGGIPRVQVGSDGKPAVGADGKPAVTYDVLRNQDGSVWRAPSDEAERELRGQKTSATEVISMIDEIRAIRARVGGESKLLNSEDSQRLGVLKERVKLLTKKGTQGMSSDKDMETLEGAAGTSDADSWRSQEGKLLEARARTESALNQAFRDAKYSGPAISFPEGAAAKNTPEDTATQRLLQKPDETFEGAVKRSLDEVAAQRGYGVDISDPGDRVLYQGIVADLRKRFNPGASGEQQVRLQQLGGQLGGAGPEASDARKTLEAVSREAHTTQLRDLAQDQLDAGPRASIMALAARGVSDGPDAIAARRELQRLAATASSEPLKALAAEQLDKIDRAKREAAARPQPAPPIDIPPEFRLGGQ